MRTKAEKSIRWCRFHYPGQKKSTTSISTFRRCFCSRSRPKSMRESISLFHSSSSFDGSGKIHFASLVVFKRVNSGCSNSTKRNSITQHTDTHTHTNVNKDRTKWIATKRTNSSIRTTVALPNTDDRSQRGPSPRKPSKNAISFACGKHK